ncbi:MAG: 50S ribosomal protein L11 methyltransferase [Alphaproteobacteria bacterium]|nr:50S ribosomal protein L11 methyltransferase [Alphaproteobacteria bacterium]
MFNTCITLPAAIGEHGIRKIVDAFGALEIQCSVSRQSGDADWDMQFLSEDRPDIRALQTILHETLETLQEGLGPSLSDLPPNFSEEARWQVHELEDIDWLAHSYRQFPPFSVGPFFIHGSHYDGAIPQSQMALQIDAATAFGSGEHGTTRGCLEALLDLKGRGACPWNVLDMGTGSGILALAAWKLWKTPVLAVDDDPEAVRMAAHHQSINGVPDGAMQMSCVCGDGFAEELTQARKPYDLIIANILAVTLREMAPALKAVSDENGYVVLSGILNTQAQSVIECYALQDMVLKNRIEIGEWSTLTLQNTTVQHHKI